MRTAYQGAVDNPRPPHHVSRSGESRRELRRDAGSCKLGDVTPPVDATPDDPEGLDDEAESGDRPTLVPAFDVEAFARESEMRQRAAARAAEEPTVDVARRLLDEGNPEQAMFLLARLLEQVPLHQEARDLSKECSVALEHDCLAALGSSASILVVAVPPDELRTLGLDHVSGFLLSLMDGVSEVETLLDLSGLPRLLALRHLRDLLARSVVRVKRRGAST